MSSAEPTNTPPSSSSGFKLAVLISGSGTNLQALIDACVASRSPSSSSASRDTTSSLVTTSTSPLKPQLPTNTTVVHVLSNRKSAYGIQRATLAHIPTTYHNLLAYKKSSTSEDEAREQYDVDLARLILHNPDPAIPAPDLIVCAGFMHVLSPSFLQNLRAHDPPVDIINLHPALPGAFSGTDAIARAWQAFQRGDIAGSGVMIHRVVEEVDMGEPLVVKDVEMRVGEGLSEFEERVHQTEWVAIVEGTAKALEEMAKRRSSAMQENADETG